MIQDFIVAFITFQCAFPLVLVLTITGLILAFVYVNKRCRDESN